MNENNQEVSKNEGIKTIFEEKEYLLKQALPRHLDLNKMKTVIAIEMQKNPKLKECTPISLFSCVLQSAQLGLYPDSLLGDAYLIPYRNNQKNCCECQFRPGYKGLMKLAYNSNQIESIRAYVVYKSDHFSYSIGTSSFLDFRPNLDAKRDDKKDEVRCYLAIAHLKSGRCEFSILKKEDIEKHKIYSKTANGNYSPWTTHYDEMAKKTAVRDLLNSLPKNSEDLRLPTVISLDEQADVGAQDIHPLLMKDIEENNELEKIKNPSQQTSKASKLAESISIKNGENK